MTTKITIDTTENKGQISRHIYGHFAEHLGRCIYEGLWVGEDSDIPNTNGIRNDVVEALRQLNIPSLRWPGGCFADEYHWKDGIGPRDQRPKMVNTHWGMVTEDNSFGTHEFLELCEQLDCEPIICGNLGSGAVQEMSQWVEYINSSNLSPMTDLRKQNGRDKPWNLKYWGVGNENWGCGGAMRPEYYFDEMMRFSTFCKNYAPNTLYRIATGPNTDDYNWTEVMMREWSKKHAWEKGRMDAISLHYYTVPHTFADKGSATDFTEDDWFVTLQKALHMDELITEHLKIMDKYDPDKKIDLVVDEWGVWHNVEPDTNPGFLFQQNTLRDALVAGITFNIFNQHCDRVHMANIAQMINVLQAMILTKDDEIIFTPTYHVFDMYKVHQDATLLETKIEGNSNYSYQDGNIPQISVSASKDEAGDIHVSLCNLDPHNSAQITLTLSDNEAINQVSGQILTADTMATHNTFSQPENLKPMPLQSVITDNTITLELAPMSVSMLELTN